MRVRLRGPLAEFELCHWSLRGSDDEPEPFADIHAATRLLRSILAESSSFGLRRLVEQIEGSIAFLDEPELIERLAAALCRGTIVALRRPYTILDTHPPARLEVYEPHEPEPFEEPESVFLSVSAQVDAIGLSVSHEPETLDLATTHQHIET